MKRDVSTRITVSVTEPANLVFAIAVAAAYRPAAERLEVTLDGAAVEVVELLDLHGTRLHQVEVGPGTCTLTYAAAIEGRTAPAGAAPADLIRYLRPSRYAESDELAPTATAEFGGIEAPADLLAAVSSWVGTRLAYVSGSSGPTDGAARTLLARQGVCRDFAHLCVALLRSMNVPARLAAVYAPGLEPMDFHAVAEAWVDGAWRVVDATTLAPRSSMVRIATGRDAADTAFLTVTAGRAELVDMEVLAIVDTLPADDVTELASIG